MLFYTMLEVCADELQSFRTGRSVLPGVAIPPKMAIGIAIGAEETFAALKGMLVNARQHNIWFGGFKVGDHLVGSRISLFHPIIDVLMSQRWLSEWA